MFSDFPKRRTAPQLTDEVVPPEMARGRATPWTQVELLQHRLLGSMQGCVQRSGARHSLDVPGGGRAATELGVGRQLAREAGQQPLPPQPLPLAGPPEPGPVPPGPGEELAQPELALVPAAAAPSHIVPFVGLQRYGMSLRTLSAPSTGCLD